MLEFFPIIVAFVSLFFVWWLISWIKKQPLGTDKMREVASAIKIGANAFIKRQYKTIGWISLLLALALFLVYTFTGDSELGWQTAFAFILGALSSAIAGIVGMKMSTTANLRSAAASKSGFNSAMQVAFRGGAITGIIVVALSLFGISGLFLFYKFLGYDVVKIPTLIVGYGFGASLVALFAQLGGGIYTK
ncbi:MAG: sodium/proton-translocating pyrophosphatase, partial [Candidatus Niyogibacteria bacterium]|nr:sodium/proton-translocating pyrophosphatase [Candidatus Niyogibacteria bacterium]